MMYSSVLAGELVTIAGWVTSPGLNPVWIRKDLSVVRRNQELRGQGALFQQVQGFGRPMDVAFDPQSPHVLYVPDIVRHCIWKIEILQEVPGAAPTAEVGTGELTLMQLTDMQTNMCILAHQFLPPVPSHSWQI
jgi:hypothetical protein